MLDLILHLNVHLGHLTAQLGGWSYALLFAILFAETGLVVTPFLPGDSLLFAVGALAAVPESQLNISWILPLMVFAVLAGDTVNYAVGTFFGERVLVRHQRWIRPEHLQRTHDFYERYGRKTIVLARFVPIVRTFAPFLAGLGKMSYRHFVIYSISGALTWIGSLTLAGYWFGNLPAMQRNFHFVIVAILVISVLPMAIEFLRTKRAAHH
jgi:membrane-associated protein